MKKNKNNIIIQFPRSKNFKELAKKAEELDPNQFAKEQAKEEAIGKITETVDNYYALTGEPITTAVSFLMHSIELAEILNGTMIKNSGSKLPIIITSSQSQQIEDEDEI
ncbi:MAG: hypothetical protein GQ532_11835 [Methylomarinum sp.]|nr:hypothetical protein [Methylomarinum sp.]